MSYIYIYQTLETVFHRDIQTREESWEYYGQRCYNVARDQIAKFGKTHFSLEDVCILDELQGAVSIADETLSERCLGCLIYLLNRNKI